VHVEVALNCLIVASAADVVPSRFQRSDHTMQIRFRFHSHDFTALLEANPSARDLMTLMPLSMMIEDYSTNEKIAYLPRKLTERGAAPFQEEAVGDLCYYAPWGNLVFYYDRYRYSSGLIRLGRLNGGAQPLMSRGKFPLAAELVT
jgi:hypothetical protein